jgi:PTS system ascorbate-specific IIB component
MLKVLVACANGAGSSLMIKMKVEKVLKELNVPVAKMHHCSLSEGKSAATQFDVVFCPLNFASMFDRAKESGTTIIGLRNILSEAEIKEKFLESGVKDK